MHSLTKFVCIAIFLASSVLAAPKNTFRPWKIGMGNNPVRPMGIPEPPNYEAIVGQIVKPKGAKGLKENMPPPAGHEPQVQIPEVKRTDGKLKNDKGKTDGRLRRDKEVMMEQKPGNGGG